MDVKKFKSWTWPALIGLVVFFSFAVPQSDFPSTATFVAGLFACQTIAVYLLARHESPPFAGREAFRWLTFGFAFFLLTVIGPLLVVACLPDDMRGGLLFDPSAALVETIKLGGVACAFLLGMRASATDEGAKNLFDGLLYIGGAWAVASIILFILDPAGIYGYEKFGAGRLTGAFSSPNSAGTLFGAVAIMALGRAIGQTLSRKDLHILERIEPVMAGVCLASFAALMLTISRGGIVATFLCVPIICLITLYGKISLPKFGLVAAVLILATLVMFAVPLSVFLGRMGRLDTDGLVRATIFKSHLAFAVQQPWFGSGLGAFKTVNSAIVTADNYQDLSVIRTAHNVYLQWFEETGVAGMAGLLALNAAVLTPMIRSARNRRHMGTRLWAIMGGYLVFLLHGMTDYAFQEPSLAYFVALLLGCGFALASNKGEPMPRKTASVRK